MESERLQRIRQSRWNETTEEAWKKDAKFAARLRLLLDHPDIDEYCMVDAYYYDFSELPDHIADQCYRDMYMIYGTTTNAQMIRIWTRGDAAYWR